MLCVSGELALSVTKSSGRGGGGGHVTLTLRRSKYKGTRSGYRGALVPQSLATSFEWQNAVVMVLRTGETKDLSLELELV